MEAFLTAPSTRTVGPSTVPLHSANVAKQQSLRENSSAVVVGSWAVVGAAVALTRRGRGRCARQAEATEAEAFDVWNPSTYGNITMDDVKKYGAAGTLSYVITELIFWAVAFPTEVFIYLQTAGHWPDFSKPEESAAVFGMVFAASNVARLLLPLRFGAALAMAPWVDENIMQRFSGGQEAKLAVAANAAAELRVEAARAQLGSEYGDEPAMTRAAARRVEAARQELQARARPSPQSVPSSSSASSLREFLMEVR
ncbi:unnamed protein product [Symbiodinium sp. CCMP2592]|nr:unnamed protein product [Symbiodinium sp. CCMP2592]